MTHDLPRGFCIEVREAACFGPQGRGTIGLRSPVWLGSGCGEWNVFLDLREDIFPIEWFVWCHASSVRLQVLSGVGYDTQFRVGAIVSCQQHIHPKPAGGGGVVFNHNPDVVIHVGSAFDVGREQFPDRCAVGWPHAHEHFLDEG